MRNRAVRNAVVALCLGVVTVGCATKTQSGAAVGGLSGAGLGAIIGGAVGGDGASRASGCREGSRAA